MAVAHGLLNLRAEIGQRHRIVALWLDAEGCILQQVFITTTRFSGILLFRADKTLKFEPGNFIQAPQGTMPNTLTNRKLLACGTCGWFGTP
jgi:hypothetical protein